MHGHSVYPAPVERASPPLGVACLHDNEPKTHKREAHCGEGNVEVLQHEFLVISIARSRGRPGQPWPRLPARAALGRRGKAIGWRAGPGSKREHRLDGNLAISGPAGGSCSARAAVRTWIVPFWASGSRSGRSHTVVQSAPQVPPEQRLLISRSNGYSVTRSADTNQRAGTRGLPGRPGGR